MAWEPFTRKDCHPFNGQTTIVSHASVPADTDQESENGKAMNAQVLSEAKSAFLGQNATLTAFRDIDYTSIKRRSIMGNMKKAEYLISERWPRLKKKLYNEKNPEHIVLTCEEIDCSFLFNLEMIITAQDGSVHSSRRPCSDDRLYFRSSRKPAKESRDSLGRTASAPSRLNSVN
jgi:hypothetical protein